MGWSRFVDECCNPVTPALFAPRDVDCAYAIPDWMQRHFGPGIFVLIYIYMYIILVPRYSGLDATPFRASISGRQ